ncbi:MAG: hypothetical protein ACOY9J_11960 [Pseudomonadota bacterium]
MNRQRTPTSRCHEPAKRHPARQGVGGLAAVLAFGIPVSASAAMGELDDEAMSAVNARDGIELSYATPNAGTPIGSVTWDVDVGKTAVGSVTVNPEVFARWEGLRIRAVDANGALLASPATTTLSFDVGDNEVTDTDNSVGLGISGNWSRMRLLVDAFRQENVSANSPGTFAFDSAGTFSFMNTKGLFNDVGTAAGFNLDISDASLYFRQGGSGAPEVLFDNILFNVGFNNGTIGVNNAGLRVAAANLNFNLTFDLRYEGAPDAAFTYEQGTAGSNDRPVMYYGWQGTLTDFELGVKGGGIWYGATGSPAVENVANRSEGLNFSARWNYDSTFAWVVGESNPSGSGNPRVQVQFDTWLKINNTAGTYAFDTPNNTLDVVKANQSPGYDGTAGTGGMCWGTQTSMTGPSATCAGSAVAAAPASGTTPATPGYYPQWLYVAPEEGIALVSRDAKQWAYSNRIVIKDDFNNDGDYADTDSATASDTPNIAPSTAETQTANFGFIYTLGNFDANIFFYPGGWDFANNAATTTGLKLDFLIMTQSHDGSDTGALPDWNTGSHYMMADNDVDNDGIIEANDKFGVGFLGSSILLAANDLYLTLTSAGVNFRTRSGTTPGEVRVQFKGRFGGGDLPDMASPVRGLDINANFESNNFQFTLEPPASGGVYIGFSGLVDFVDLSTANFAENGTSGTSGDDGTFIEIAEPSRPSAALRFANITGRIQYTGGKLDLVSDSEIANQPAKILVSSSVNMGATAVGIPAGGGATASAGAPLQVGRIEFGGNTLGSIVVPSGTWYAAIGLKRQL